MSQISILPKSPEKQPMMLQNEEKPTLFFGSQTYVNTVPVLCEAYLLQEAKFNPFECPELAGYCLCDYIQGGDSACRSHESAPTKEVAPAKKKERKRNKAVFKPKIIQQADVALKRLASEPVKDLPIFKRADKSSMPPDHVPVKERAKFIGVSKNGRNWQSLIVINNTKVYLGTYKTQVEAAVMFDFHSMVVKYKSAKVNFDYSANDLVKMIEVFKKNGNEFDSNLYFAMK